MLNVPHLLPLYLLWFLTIMGISNTVHAQNSQPEGFDYSKIEPWVTEYDVAEASSALSQPVRYHMIDTQYDFRNASHKEFYRQAAEPITASGVLEASEIHLAFNPKHERLSLHYIKAVRGDHSRDLTHSVSPRFLEQEPEIQRQIQSGYVSIIFNLPDVRVGDRIEYAYTKSGHNPVLGDKPFGGLRLSWSVAVDQVRARILSDEELFINVENAPQNLEKQKRGSTYEYQYATNHTPIVKNEGNYPHDVVPYGWMQFSAYDSWAAVSDWAQQVYARVPESNKIKAIARDIEHRSHDTNEYIRKVIDFVQNDIRYLGLEFGENTHLPRDPDEVLATRFGDCKDKAMLISLLLKEKGVNAYPALVSTDYRSGIGTMLPSPGAFDHVINLIEFNGEQFWVDGTSQYQAGDVRLRGSDDYGYALLINHNNRELVDMYEATPTRSLIDVNESYHIKTFNGPVEYRIETRYSGAMAEFQRHRFSNNSKEKISEEYRNFYLKYFEEIDVLQLPTMVDDRSKNEVAVTEKYRLSSMVEETSGSHLMHINLGLFPGYLIVPEQRERQHAHYIGEPTVIKNSVAVHYPSEVDLSFRGKPKVYDSDIFRYELQDDYKNKVYTHTASLQLKKDRIEPNELKQYLIDREKLLDEWFFTITTPKSDLFEGYDKIIELKSRLRTLKDSYND